MKQQWAKIGFERYKINCVIGTLAYERQHPQELIIDLNVEANITLAAASDALSDTISYVILAQMCEQIALKGQFHLLEAFAATVLESLFATFTIRKAKILVRKPGAIAGADNAFVELERE